MDTIFSPGIERISQAVRLCLAAIIVLMAGTVAAAQDKCVSPERIGILLREIKNAGSGRLNQELRSEVLAMKKGLDADDRTGQAPMKDGEMPDDNTQSNVDGTSRICSILDSYPWPGRSFVGADAASAWIAVIKTFATVSQQRDLLPVIAAGINNGEIPKDRELAAFVDRLRLRVGQPQLFGTQLTEQDGFLVLLPIESEQKVDVYRKDFGMDPLRQHLAAIRNTYRKLVIRSTAKVRRLPAARKPDSDLASTLITPETDGEPIRVDTSIVTVDATVTGKTVPELGKNDFKVYEDEQMQEITAFDASEAPFDIVLLLDLSGSTADQIGLIKKTTKHFIELMRDVDRAAIITFNSGQTVVSPLESDKKKLLDKVSAIKGTGESRIWDSEKFAIDFLRRDSPAGRRKAIVVMTDGIDNDLYFVSGLGSNILFGDLVEEIRNSPISIFPIYLTPNGPDRNNEELVQNARRTMQFIADESGGTFYTSANLNSLNAVYERVLQDMGRVYSLGYQPKNDKRDGTWRTIKVEIPDHPDLRVRARTGYYAK